MEKMPKRNSLFERIQDRSYGHTNSFDFFDATKNSRSLVQKLRLQVKIPSHNGCVNSICWNQNGRYILSGSDDRHLCISNPFTSKTESYIPTGHRSNIFSAKFLPGYDNKVVSCAGDGTIIYSDLHNPETSLVNKFICHFGTTYEVMTIHNEPHSFLSCGEDCTVRWYDLRMKQGCLNNSCEEDILLKLSSAVSALSANPSYPYQLAVGCADSSVRIYDRRMLGTAASGGFYTKPDMLALMSNFSVPEFCRNHRITSLCYSRTGEEMLVSYSSDFLYLFDVRCTYSKDPKVLSCFTTDSNKNTTKPTSSRPFMKRLRVRGDWSDTGPNARPESELGEDQPSRTLQASLMQRMSDALTNMYGRQSRINQGLPVSPSSSEGSNGNARTEDEEEEHEEGWDASDDVDNRQPPDYFSDASNSSVQIVDERPVPNGNQESESNEAIQQNSDDEPNVVSSPDKPSKSNENDNISDADLPVNDRALNMSLENIKQEMSKTSKENPQQSVINGTSSCDPSSCTTSKCNESDSDKMHSGVSEHETPTIIVHEDVEVMSHDCGSVESHCDMDNVTENGGHEGENSPPKGLESRIRHRTASSTASSSSSSSRMSEEPIPDIFIATDQADEEETSVMTDVPNENQRQMTLIMEMNAWEADYAASRIPVVPGIHVAESVPEDDEENEEDELADIRKEEDDFLKNLPQPRVLNKYIGHRNARTMIKEATFWGDDYVMSGSDCGHIFVWDRHTAELVMLMEADHHVVNCLQPHPFDPILASSGIDYDIKLWAPLHYESMFDEGKAQEIIKRNGVMLEETKDTLTVPASFMIRMLASLNHITTATGSRWRNMARRLRERRQNQ